MALRLRTACASSSPGPGLSHPLLNDLDQFHAFNAANGRKLGDFLVLKATARNLAMGWIKGADTRSAW